MDAIDTIEYRGYKIQIHSDVDAESPREWDNLGTMVCWHTRYNLGDKHNFDTPDDFYDWLKNNPAIVLPLYLYDHSGLTISTSNKTYPFNDKWDSGQVGYIYVTKEKIKDEFSPHKTRVSEKMKERAIKCLQSEVSTYDDYLTGNVYGYVIEAPDNDCIDPDNVFYDSCFGFYGHDHKTSGLLEYAQNAIDCDIEEKEAYYDKLQLRFGMALA